MISVIGVYITCSTIDFLRQKILEENIVKEKWFNNVTTKIDKVLRDEE